MVYKMTCPCDRSDTARNLKNNLTFRSGSYDKFDRLYNEAKEMSEYLIRHEFLEYKDPVVGADGSPNTGELRHRQDSPATPNKSRKIDGNKSQLSEADKRSRTLINIRNLMRKHGLKSPTEVYGGYARFLKKCPQEEIDKYLSPEKLNEGSKEPASSKPGTKMSVNYDRRQPLDGIKSDAPSHATVRDFDDEVSLNSSVSEGNTTMLGRIVEVLKTDHELSSKDKKVSIPAIMSQTDGISKVPRWCFIASGSTQHFVRTAEFCRRKKSYRIPQSAWR